MSDPITKENGASRKLGPFTVSEIGLGCMNLSHGYGTRSSDEEASRLLNEAIDLGYSHLDTAALYGFGHNEQLIGRTISHRRSEYTLASKCVLVKGEDGKRAIDGRPECIKATCEQALKNLQTDVIDVWQFHEVNYDNDPDWIFGADGAIEAAVAARQAGKIRFIGSSGTIPNIEGQLAMGVFEEFQIPYSALQREHEELITRAARAGAGTVIRGGVARGGPAEDKGWDVRRLPEVAPERPRATWEQAGLDDLLDGMSRMEFMLRFTLSHPDLHTTIVGTANLGHLRANCEVARKGPLPDEVYAEAKQRLDAAEHGRA